MTKHDLERKTGELYGLLYWHERGAFPISQIRLAAIQNQYVIFCKMLKAREYEDHLNERGNILEFNGQDVLRFLGASNEARTDYAEYHSLDRYLFDFDLCSREKGWLQYDTKQDAHYFGFWVHPERQLTVTYCEGDISLVTCPTEESYHAELAHAAEFYGPPPPAFTVIEPDKGKIIEVYDERPV